MFRIRFHGRGGQGIKTAGRLLGRAPTIGETMTKRIAISVETLYGLDSIIDPRFGRAFGYVVVDPSTSAIVEELENTSRDAAHGAGSR